MLSQCSQSETNEIRVLDVATQALLSLHILRRSCNSRPVLKRNKEQNFDQCNTMLIDTKSYIRTRQQQDHNPHSFPWYSPKSFIQIQTCEKHILPAISPSHSNYPQKKASYFTSSIGLAFFPFLLYATPFLVHTNPRPLINLLSRIMAGNGRSGPDLIAFRREA